MEHPTTHLNFLNYTLGEKPMKIGIMGAMPQEINTIKENMSVKKKQIIAGRTYYTGEFSGHEITLVFSRWGKVAAALTATTLINMFDVEFMIFTGVAGAVSPNLNLGDVVIANGLYQHDMDARPLFDQYQIPLTDSKVFKPHEEDIKKAAAASQSFFATMHENIDADMLKKFSIDKPKCVIGIIASGDQFITDSKNHSNLKLDEDEVLAVEMEGAAIAQVCHDFGIRFSVIRAISDGADDDANINFEKFIEAVASKYSAGILKKLLPTIGPGLS